MMSNALAIAAVTAVLKDLLNNALINHDLAANVEGVTVSAQPPDRIVSTQGGQLPSQLNLFLYQVVPNQGWRNVGLPSRDQRGERLTNPPLALDLRYLLTAYGANDLEAEILLGYGMQVLHETPVLTRDAIRRALAPESPVSGGILPPALRTLSAADLADQVEQVKICPHHLNTEEMSHIWSALQAHYRPSTAYHVSVVLIESRRSTRSALPVRMHGYNLYAVPFRQPVIEQIWSQAGAGKPIFAGDQLIITGQRLRGEVTQVRIGDAEPKEPDPANLSDTEITMPIPSSLRAGVRGVQVVHLMDMGTPKQPHRSIESNVAAFVLHPTIKKKADDTYEITIDGPLTCEEVGEGDDKHKVCSGTVRIKLDPKAGKEQRVVLLLNEIDTPPGRPPRAYSSWAHPWPPESGGEEFEEISFEMSEVAEGSYLVRVQVDGAESPLDVGEDGRYVSPQVVISE